MGRLKLAFEAIAGASQGAIEAVQKQEQSARRLLRHLARFLNVFNGSGLQDVGFW